MISLNLLPEGQRKELLRARRFWIVVRQATYASAVLLFFVVILVSINALLTIQLNALRDVGAQQQAQASYQELQRYEEKFKSINAQATYRLKLEKNHLFWSHLFLTLNETMPQGVTLSTFSTADNAVTITGVARQRDTLLAFRDKLTVEECLRGVDVPLADLVVRENLQFHLTFMVTEECLKRKTY